MISGTCLCGTMRYRIDHALTRMSHCHCSMCRKSQGTNFGTYAEVPASAVSFESGEEQIVRFRSAESTQRSFCPVCGSALFVEFDGGEHLYFPVGNLDAGFEARPDRHIFVASKAPWYDIPDDLPQYAAYSGDDAPAPLSQPSRGAAERGTHGGSCLCGSVTFEYDGDPVKMYNCHCLRCRRARGGAHATNLFVPRERFRWRGGAAKVRVYKLPEAERFGQAFCTDCGSAMPRVNPALPHVVIPVGCMDDDPGSRPQAHIFTGSKSDWFPISDDLPQYEAAPPA